MSLSVSQTESRNQDRLGAPALNKSISAPCALGICSPAVTPRRLRVSGCKAKGLAGKLLLLFLFFFLAGTTVLVPEPPSLITRS